MIEFNEQQILENMWGLTVSMVVNRLREIYGKEALIFELESRENIEILAREEYKKLVSMLGDECPAYFPNGNIKECLKNAGIVPNSYYHELMMGDELLRILDICGDEYLVVKDVFLSKEKYNDQSVEMCEGLYISEMVEECENSIEDYMNSLGAEIRYTFYDEDGLELKKKFIDVDEYVEELMYEAEVTNGYIYSFQGEFDFLFEVQERTNNEKLKKMINYFIQGLVNMEGVDRKVVIIKEEDAIPLVIFFEKEVDISREERCIKELVNNVELIIISDILLEELKKEGYLR